MADGPPVWRLVDFPDQPGLEARVSVPTVEARALATQLVNDFTSEDEGVIVAAVARLAVPFADSLLSWTARTPAGARAPATRKGTARVDVWVLLAVFREWIKLWPPLGVEPAAELEPVGAVDEELALLAGMPMTPLGDAPNDLQAEPDLGEPAELEAVS